MAYEADKYFDFFEIDEGFYPEINESSIKDAKNRWQNTFPHADIIELLKITERALSRASNTSNRSLWLDGSYGTGKSRILWMMQNLLSCPETEFDAYFDEYDNLRREIDLRERLRTIRRGKVITALRYSTGSITSSQKLIFAVFESLTAALKSSGCKFDGAKTLCGKIANWLEADDANRELFRAKIKKREYIMSGSLRNRSVEEIIERLKNPSAKVSYLVEDILKLGEREGIIAFKIDMKDLTEWIAEVIAENNLQAIVLFWDEFSKFFANNRNNLDELQRLAELSNIAPFYLFIATHQIEELPGAGEQGFKVVSDRFMTKTITMPDNIAFELIGHALKVKPDAQNTWTHISAALRERTAEPRKAVMKFDKLHNEKILTDLLPIHPMTAILLKNLSVYFASNQRSIFNFIKNTDPKVKAFQDFINTKSPLNGDLLTIDYLWNFFYESGTDEHGGSVGRMNLRPSIRAILDSYALNENNLSADEKIVLKALLLFQAINQESHGVIELFHPTEKNLELAFTGVADMENGRAVAIANNLVRKDILFKKPGKIETFAVMALGSDFAEIERLKKDIADRVRTAALLEGAELIKAMELELSQAQKARYVLVPVTADNFTLTINRLTNEVETYQIKVIVCIARNEDEQHKIHNLLSGALSNERYDGLVFIDASSNTMSQDIFTRWVENSASEQYWRGKDNALADKMKDNAVDCLKEWKGSFAKGSFVYYHATKTGDREKISCQNFDGVKMEITANVRRLYPYSFDDADITATLFQVTSFKNFAKAGAEQTEYQMLKLKDIKTVLGDVWQMSQNYWEVYPTLSISRLKIELDALIKSEIESDVRISFDDIFSFLLERGFMPVNIYAFLTGFLLKEYAGDPYRFSAGLDGNFGGAMNSGKLAEYVAESIKQAQSQSKNYRPKYLEIMSQNQRQFMEFASKIFDVQEDISVEQSAQKLRLKLINLGCPIWCYVDAAPDKYKDFLRLLAEIANSKEAISVSALAERAGQFLMNNPVAFYDMKNFLTAQNGREIFTDFLSGFDGGTIIELAQEIGVENTVAECQRRITAGDSIWLHDKETAEGELRKLIVDYKIILASRNFGRDGKSFSACVQSWQSLCRYSLKIPADVLGDYYPPLKSFFAMLKELTERGEIPQSKRENFLSQLTDNAEQIQDAIYEPLKVLREKYSYQLGGLNEEEIQSLYSNLPNNSFTDSQGHYHKNVADSAKKMQSAQLRIKLLNLWFELTQSKSPREWSNAHRTPILAMVPDSERQNARKIFETVMATSPEEKDVRAAIEYFEQRPKFLSALNDARKIEEAFSVVVIGEYRSFLKDNDEIRDELERKFSREAYDWHNATELVKNFAENKYYTGSAHDKVTERVERMSAESAKKLLVELVDKDFEVGLKILKES
ncbi:MAG: hypothetical protein J5809_00100 [Selenomonadaceae bacterium]|nr:hypothetical protein [Selenomonadaceae bacterium]